MVDAESWTALSSSSPLYSSRALCQSAWLGAERSTPGSCLQNRSGQATTKPRRAYQSATSRMYWLIPKISCSKTIAGPGPLGGKARWALNSTPSVDRILITLIPRGCLLSFGTDPNNARVSSSNQTEGRSWELVHQTRTSWKLVLPDYKTRTSWKLVLHVTMSRPQMSGSRLSRTELDRLY